jgi:amino acid adenylation domain-containing protein
MPTFSQQVGFIKTCGAPRKLWGRAHWVGKERLLMSPDKVFPLTFTQNDIYLDQCRRTRNPLYNVGGYIRFSSIDLAKLRVAHERLIREHDVFGIRVYSAGDQIIQTISDARTTALPLVDFSGEDRPEAAADAWQRSLFETALDFHDSELFRVFLVKIAGNHYRYVGLAHHLMMDGWGFSNWAKRLALLYADPFSPLDYIPEWRELSLQDQDYLGSAKYLADKHYWSEQMKGSTSFLTPRYLRELADQSCIPSQRRAVQISRTEFCDLQRMAGDAGGGVAHHFLAMLAVYFSNSSGQNRLVFGLPFHNRKGSGQKRMLGVFTSISPLCLDLSDETITFGELVQQIASWQKACFRHQRYPLGHIVRDLAEIGQYRFLYDVGFNYLKITGELLFTGSLAELRYVSHNHEVTPLMVTLCEYGELGPVELQLDYNLAYFDEADALRLLERFSFLVRSLRDAYHTRLVDLQILPQDEIDWILSGFDGQTQPHLSSRFVHQLFEEQVLRSPDAAAVTAEHTTLSYCELNQKANRIAHCLIRNGVGPESLVGILMERDTDLLACVLGVLKAGGAYVPLDPVLPPQRIRTIVQDDGIRFIIGRVLPSAVNLDAAQFISLKDIPADDALCNLNPDPEAIGLTASNVAYIIYTSGSTGKPKGVQITHANAVCFLEWATRIYSPEDLAAVLASTSLSFDLSVFEMFAPLCVGGRCVIVKDALALVTNPASVTLINTVPSAIRVLVEQHSIPAGVRLVNLAGESLPMKIVNDLLTGSLCKKVCNLYGPSEDTTYSTYAAFDAPLSATPSIGRSISGTQTYVLSPGKRLVPVGDIGELHIAGRGLSRGYLNRPELTAQKFVCNPFSQEPGDRMYATGDLVRYQGNGQLEYLGRIDDQIKIRGFRVEPGEIAAQLASLEGVMTAVVLVKGGAAGGEHLAAYVERRHSPAVLDEPQDIQKWADGLRLALRSSLPEYMVPAFVTVLDPIPLTPNGKVDKKALLALKDEGESERRHVAPTSATEIRLAALWAAILGIETRRVGATTNLLDLGGHSLLLARLSNQIRVELGVTLSLRAMCGALNIRELAASIDAEKKLQGIAIALNGSAIVSEGYI